MLYKLKRRKKIYVTYIGDNVSVIYRFKGIFFIITGNCVYNKKKNMGVSSKRTGIITLVSVLKKSINVLNKLGTFFFNNIKVKMSYRRLKVK